MSSRHSREHLPGWMALVWATSLLLTIGLALDVSPWLRGDLDWRWTYRPFVFPQRIFLASLALGLYIGLGYAAWRWVFRRSAARSAQRRRAALVVWLTVVAGVGVQLVVQTISDPDPWRELLLRTSSPFLQGYWNAALDVSNVGEFLRHFTQIAPAYDVPHVQRHPPGFVVYFVAWQRLMAAFPGLGDWIAGRLNLYRCEYWPHLFVTDSQYAAIVGGLLAPLLNALQVVPLYAVARRLLSPSAALGAVLVSPLIPGYVVWSGHWDQAFPLVTLTLLWLLHGALFRRQVWAWGAAGGLLSAALLFTHAMLALVGFAGVYSLLHVISAREYWGRHRWQLFLSALAFVAGLCSVWVLYWLLFDVTYFDVFRANTASHFGLSMHYLSRLFYDPYDHALFMGYAIGLLIPVALVRVVRARVAGSRFSAAHVVVLAYALVLALLVVVAVGRAEVGRVWLFLVPLALLCAFMVSGGPGHSPERWLLTAGLLAAQTVVMQVVLFGERDVRHVYEMPAVATPVGTRVGEAIQLQGYQVDKAELAPGAALNATLYWRALQPPAGFYTVFTHLYSTRSGVAAQHDAPPRDGKYPTTCWLPGEVVADRIELKVPSDAAPGVYELIVGLYDPAAANQRLPTAGPGARDLAIVLTEIHVLARANP